MTGEFHANILEGAASDSNIAPTKTGAILANDGHGPVLERSWETLQIYLK